MASSPKQILIDGLAQTHIKGLYDFNSVRKKLEDKFKNLLYEDLRLTSLVSYVGNKKIPFLRLYRYKEAFSFTFVKDFLKKLQKEDKK